MAVSRRSTRSLAKLAIPCRPATKFGGSPVKHNKAGRGELVATGYNRAVNLGYPKTPRTLFAVVLEGAWSPTGGDG
jgi:hypothetical protein